MYEGRHRDSCRHSDRSRIVGKGRGGVWVGSMEIGCLHTTH